MKLIFTLILCACAAWGEMRSIPATRADAAGALDPVSPVWKTVPAVAISLQRTPLLYPTDQPASLDIPSAQLQIIRAAGKMLVRVEWQDKTPERSTLAKAERSWQTEKLVKQTEATDRFSDACAIMTPLGAPAEVFPSLQMGDAAHPVRIYVWDSSRGAAVMEARGRETTRKTGNSFPAQAAWNGGKWTAVLELPELPQGAPVALAIWNGGQQDRDGRKYFSIWYKTN